MRRFTKRRNCSTLQARQSGNLPFNFGGMTKMVPPFYRTADQSTLRGPHLDNLTFNFKGATFVVTRFYQTA